MTTTSTIAVPDATTIAAIGKDVCAGRELGPSQARALLEVAPGSPAWSALMTAAQEVRNHVLGRQVHLCSIVNTKAGNCSENCSYCSQASGVSNDDYDPYKWMPDDDILAAAESAAANGAGALGLVAAWKGIKEGAQLDMVCDAVERLTAVEGIRPDVNLGILESQHCADRIAAAGAQVYGHNLETARSFFDQTCSSHDFDERLETIGYIKRSGMALCSGGIVGMGESREQRIEFAEQLRFIQPHMIPINFLNPLPGTALEGRAPMATDEALTTLAVFRLFLPDRNIMVAGGKEVTFGARLAEVFAAGVNAVMVGNYLTTLGTSPEWWHEQIRAAGLEAHGDAGGGCGCG